MKEKNMIVCDLCKNVAKKASFISIKISSLNQPKQASRQTLVDLAFTCTLDCCEECHPQLVQKISNAIPDGDNIEKWRK